MAILKSCTLLFLVSLEHLACSALHCAMRGGQMILKGISRALARHNIQVDIGEQLCGWGKCVGVLG
eukprot:549593-Pelagomonas_calceolata.AAC.3